MAAGTMSEWNRLSRAVVGAVDEGDSLLRRFQPETWSAIGRELDTLARRLEASAVEVQRPTSPPTELIRSGTDFVFVRDSAVVVDGLVVETELRDPDRRQERYALRPFLERLARDVSAELIRMDPVGATDTAEGSAFLEGGDILVLEKDILVGHSGRGSSELGISRLRDRLPADYRIHRVVLDPLFWHLDLALMAVRPGLAICYPAAFPSGLPGCIREWEFIEANEKEATSFAVNGLILEEGLCLLSAGQDRLADELRRRGTEVELIPFDHVLHRNGGLRCATLPLERSA